MHISAILVIAAAVLATRIDISSWELGPTPEAPRSRKDRVALSARGGQRITEEAVLPQPGLLRTTAGERKTPTPVNLIAVSPAREVAWTGGPAAEATAVVEAVARTEVITYVVQAGDIVGSIAQRFGVSSDSIVWANTKLEGNPDLLQIGQVLLIPPVSGVLHTVQKGDTLEAISKRYKASIEDIMACPMNKLTDAQILIEGQLLMVPGGQKPYVPRVVSSWSGPIPQNAAKGTGVLGWPTTGIITQSYWNLHRAIDIAWQRGTAVIAADSGFVIEVGNSPGGYGIYVVIDHGNGLQTWYAHLDAVYVSKGQSVSKGQKLGPMGNTGKSTGPHLHFEVRKNGVQMNPLNYLP